MINKFKTVCLTAAIASSSATFAGGLLTNTNQHVAFNRMMSREASIGIDGVYYNPAGVVFMGEGNHLAINWQAAWQTRTINNDYKLFTNNVNSTRLQGKGCRAGYSFFPVRLQQGQMVVPGQLRADWRRR